MNPVLNISLAIFGIVVMAAAPPVGFFMIVAAFASGGSHHGKVNRHRRALAAKQTVKEERARILAFKSL